MADDSELTPEEKKRKHQELVSFVSTYLRKCEKAAKNLATKSREWKDVREDTIRIVENAAELIKYLNNNIDYLQTMCKIGSAGGKIATLFGPVSVVAGSAISVTSDGLYLYCSKGKTEELKNISAQVLSAIDKDHVVTAELFDAKNKIKRISETLRDCVETFRSGTEAGFFDNVPSLRSFVNAVKGIKDVKDLEGLRKFLSVLKEEAEGLADDPDLFSSVVLLLTYDPHLSVTVPEILVNFGIVAVGGMPCGMAGNVVRGLNVLGIMADICDIVSKIFNYNTYPKIAEELLKIKVQLEKEKNEIDKMKEEIAKE